MGASFRACRSPVAQFWSAESRRGWERRRHFSIGQHAEVVSNSLCMDLIKNMLELR
jgi:hypothetical protein